MPSPYAPLVPLHIVERAVAAALEEDLGQAGDITSQATISPDATAVARINARVAGVLCGLGCAEAAFRLIGPGITVTPFIADGARLEPGKAVLEVAGNARLILSAERTALNFLTHLSGVATLTRQFADATAGTGAHVCCTRKTTPGLRALEKYAVRCGGGHNHRFGLDDAVLIKDNHIAIAGGVKQALERARASVGHLVKIEIEVDTLEQLNEVLEVGADAILLDNMSPETLAEAVRQVNGRAITEASGRITPDTAPQIAAAGVDLISVGWITHSAPILDLGLDVG